MECLGDKDQPLNMNYLLLERKEENGLTVQAISIIAGQEYTFALLFNIS